MEKERESKLRAAIDHAFDLAKEIERKANEGGKKHPYSEDVTTDDYITSIHGITGGIMRIVVRPRKRGV